jgi:hypothetical protein
MSIAKSLHRTPCAILFAFAFITFPGIASAVVLYNQDFETAAVGPTPPPDFSISYIGGAGASAPQYAITSNGGVAGTKGFTMTFDTTNQEVYSAAFGTSLSASDAHPLGNGSVLTDARIRFSMDLKTTGNVIAAAVKLNFSQFDSNYEADRGIDANQDGDMNDGATVFNSVFTPTLVNGSDFVHVSFLLSEGVLTANINRPPSLHLPAATFPLIPTFDPTVPLQIGISNVNGAYGMDSGNTISVDNLLVESVPEPSTAALLVIGCIACLAVLRRLLGADELHCADG